MNNLCEGDGYRRRRILPGAQFGDMLGNMGDVPRQYWPTVAISRSWKGWDVNDHHTGGDAKRGSLEIARLVGGVSLGTVHEQRFYAIRANGSGLCFPFSPQPFTAMVDISRPVDDEVLTGYANALIEHGCVQAICRGEDSDRLEGIFNNLAEQGELDRSGQFFTSMCVGDEPLTESLQYFILPSGLAQTGLLMVIGDVDDFRETIEGFSTATGALKEDFGQLIYTEADPMCLAPS